MTNHSTFDNGSLGVPFHHIQHLQTTEDLEKNDFDATIFQQTNDVDVTQDDIAPQLQGHRKSHILSELDYFLKRCETVESSDMRPGPRNVNNHQYISMLADRVQHHHHNHYRTNESENHTYINTMQQSIHDGNSNHQSVQTLTKNYIALATEYKMWDRYRIHRNFTNPCVVCLQFNALVKVFFPCEHRCICEPCFLKAKCWRECPLCKEGVRLTLVRKAFIFLVIKVPLILDSFF